LFLFMSMGSLSGLWHVSELRLHIIYEHAESRWKYIERENRRTGRKTCPSATLPTINRTWIERAANPCLRCERPATNLPADGGKRNFWNVGLFQREYTTLYPKKLSPSFVTMGQWSIHCWNTVGHYSRSITAMVSILFLITHLYISKNNYHAHLIFASIFTHDFIHFICVIIFTYMKSSTTTRLWRGRGRYNSCSFTTSALDGGEWSASRSGCSLPLEKGPPPQYPLDRRLDGPHSQRLEEQSSLPPPGIERRSPGRSVHSQTLY
jgi:hypothetical protein